MSMLLTGLRGVGKTVLLREMERIAKAEGYRTIMVEAHEQSRLGELLIPPLQKLLFELDRAANRSEKVRRGFAVLRAFLGTVKLSYENISVGLDIDPERGSADSGNLEFDLPNLFVAVAEAAADRDTAIAAIISKTVGYPYFLQEWGYQVWTAAESTPVGHEVVTRASPQVERRLDENVFRVRFDRLTPGEKSFLRAMAELGAGPYRIGEVGDQLDVKVTSLGPRRAQLIRKGMIYSPAHGELAFTVPLFDEFMRRCMPSE